MLQHSANRAMHLRHAAQAICVLHPGVVFAMRLANLRTLHQPHQVSSRVNLPFVRPCQMNSRIKCRWRTHQSLQRHCARQVAEPHHAARSRRRKRAHCGHRLRAVQERQSLLRSQRQWLKPRPPQRFSTRQPRALIERLPLTDHNERQMRQRRQIAARSHRSLFRNHRVNARVEKRNQQLQQLRPHPAESLCKHIRAQQQHRSRFRFRQRLANPARMTAHKVDLQLGQPLRRNAHI